MVNYWVWKNHPFLL